MPIININNVRRLKHRQQIRLGLPACMRSNYMYFWGVDLYKSVDVQKTQWTPNPIEHTIIAVTSETLFKQNLYTVKASILNLYLFYFSIPYSNTLYIRYFLSIWNKPNMTKWVIHFIITHDYIRNIFGSAVAQW